MAEFSTKGTKLEVKASGEGTFKKCYGLYNTPDMGGNKEKLDVTNLEDSHKRTIDGIADYGSLQFDFYDTINEADSSTAIRQTYSAFRTWELAGTEVNFRLTYPDGTGFTWSGTVSTTRDAASVNSAMKFKVYSSLSTAISDFSSNVSVLSLSED